MQKFCHNCGKQLSVGAKFCAECGTSLSSLNNKPTPPEVPARPSQFVPFAAGRDENEDDDSYLDKIDHINIRQSELQVDIIKDRPIGESVGTLIAQALQSGRPTEIEPPRSAPPIDQNAFLAEFKREAGTMRNETSKSS